LHVTREERGVNLVAETEEGYRFPEPITGVRTIAAVSAATTTTTLNDDYSTTAKSVLSLTPVIAAGGRHAVGLRDDGTVVAVGGDTHGQCDADGWMLK
jgi:alpha-tubulin suppressor-like RCC1 family protein